LKSVQNVGQTETVGLTSSISQDFSFERALLKVTQDKNIITTKIMGKDGTIKEYIGLDDYKIQIEAFIYGYNGIYPYDASKSITDIVCNSYRNTYKMPVVTTRACNIYGTGDNNIQRLVPGLVKAYKDNALFTIRNGGRDIREYINVKDVVSAYANILVYAEIVNNIPSFNISSGERYSTLEVFNIVQNAIGKEINHEIIESDGFEIKKQFMNSSLLQERTGWKPEHTMKDSMKEIVEFYMDNK
jgi:nucleoside-diphosphate-sugar epimerase